MSGSMEHPNSLSVRDRYRLAGCWLILAGLTHLALINRPLLQIELSAVDWSPLSVALLGAFVAFRSRIASTLARVLGSFAIPLVFVGLIITAAGLPEGSKLTYGEIEISNPRPWHILVSVVGLAATFIPPWWLLQTAIRDSDVFHRNRWRDL
jgi:hypothetical protein